MKDKPDAVEADLQRFYQIDIRDRWLRGPHRLTFRRMGVLLQNLPQEAAIWGKLPSGVEVHVMEVRDLFAGERHPELDRLEKAIGESSGGPSGLTGKLLAERAAAYE